MKKKNRPKPESHPAHTNCVICECSLAGFCNPNGTRSTCDEPACKKEHTRRQNKARWVLISAALAKMPKKKPKGTCYYCGDPCGNRLYCDTRCCSRQHSYEQHEAYKALQPRRVTIKCAACPKKWKHQVKQGCRPRYCQECSDKRRRWYDHHSVTKYNERQKAARVAQAQAAE
jgi:hypothetical protein